MGMGENGGIFGEPGLVIIRAKDELHNRCHWSALLNGEAAVFDQLVESFGLLFGCNRDIIGAADCCVECLAAAIFRDAGILGEFAC